MAEKKIVFSSRKYIAFSYRKHMQTEYPRIWLKVIVILQ